jgi:hypothetical protein
MPAPCNIYQTNVHGHPSVTLPLFEGDREVCQNPNIFTRAYISALYLLNHLSLYALCHFFNLLKYTYVYKKKINFLNFVERDIYIMWGSKILVASTAVSN